MSTAIDHGVVSSRFVISKTVTHALIIKSYSRLAELSRLSKTAPVEDWPLSYLDNRSVSQSYPLSVLRLDRVLYNGVSEIGGNKVFKLLPNIADALAQGESTVLSFGGRWSNHLWSLSAAANHFGLESIGFVNGERQMALTPTLLDAQRNGMVLHMLPRRHFVKLQWLTSIRRPDLAKAFPEFASLYPEAYVIPAGGCNAWGVLGAYILGCNLAHRFADYRWVCAAGSGSMVAGLSLARAALSKQGAVQAAGVVGISVADSLPVLADRIGGIMDDLRGLLNRSELAQVFAELDMSVPINFRLESGFDYLHLRSAETEFAAQAKPKNISLVESQAYFKQLQSPELEPFEPAIEPVYLLPLLKALQRDLKHEEVGEAPILVIHGGGLQGARRMSD